MYVSLPAPKCTNESHGQNRILVLHPQIKEAYSEQRHLVKENFLKLRGFSAGLFIIESSEAGGRRPLLHRPPIQNKVGFARWRPAKGNQAVG